MFKLVALLFLVTNGVPAEEPSGSLAKNDSFATKAACEDFSNGEEGISDKARIAKVAATKNMTVKFVCVAAEDNSI